MTTEKLIDGIVGAIAEEFGAGYPIRTENNEQGFDGPCFYVRCVQPWKRRFFWRRYYREWLMAVHFFPGERAVDGAYEPNLEMNNASERLFDCLETFDTEDGPVRIKDASMTVSDDVLVMSLTVEVYETRDEAYDLMQTQTTIMEASDDSKESR